MAIGRIAALLGALSPTEAADRGQPETARDGLAIAAAADAQADQQFNNKDGGDAAAQIQAVIGAIRQSGESAGQEGAGMAFSQSGGQFRDSVAALSHLLRNAHDSRTSLPQPLLNQAAEVLVEVEAQVESVRTAVEERMSRMDSAGQERVRQTAGPFLAELQNAVYNLRSVLGNMPGVTVANSQPQQSPSPYRL